MDKQATPVAHTAQRIIDTLSETERQALSALAEAMAESCRTDLPISLTVTDGGAGQADPSTAAARLSLAYLLGE